MVDIIHNYRCDICGKPKIQGKHGKCSKIRQRRYQAEQKAKKTVEAK